MGECIKIDVKEMAYEGVDKTQQSKGNVPWRAVVNTL